MPCPRCQSSNTTRRAGTTSLGYARYGCRSCHRRFNERTGTPVNDLQHPTDVVLNAVLWPLLILNTDQCYTLPVRIAKLSGVWSAETNVRAAACVIAVAPVIAFFLLLQRWFIQGITVGAVKG